MSIQECALYGDLVLYPRDSIAIKLVEMKAHHNLEEATHLSHHRGDGNPA